MRVKDDTVMHENGCTSLFRHHYLDKGPEESGVEKSYGMRVMPVPNRSPPYPCTAPSVST